MSGVIVYSPLVLFTAEGGGPLAIILERTVFHGRSLFFLECIGENVPILPLKRASFSLTSAAGDHRRRWWAPANVPALLFLGDFRLKALSIREAFANRVWKVMTVIYPFLFHAFRRGISHSCPLSPPRDCEFN